MDEKVDILGIKINYVTMKQAEQAVYNMLSAEKEQMNLVVTPNAEMVVRAKQDKELAYILNDADLAIPDGAGIILASQILSVQTLSERVAGFDLMARLLEYSHKRQVKIFLLGGKPGIADKAKKNIENKFPEISICGCHHGYLDTTLKEDIIDKINDKKPDILLAGMGVPHQEKFLYNQRKKLSVKVGMTVGGSFDVWAGEATRAPLWMQRAYLEWFYRLLKDPSRINRMISIPYFSFIVYDLVLSYLSITYHPQELIETTLPLWSFIFFFVVNLAITVLVIFSVINKTKIYLIYALIFSILVNITLYETGGDIILQIVYFLFSLLIIFRYRLFG